MLRLERVEVRAVDHRNRRQPSVDRADDRADHGAAAAAPECHAPRVHFPFGHEHVVRAADVLVDLGDPRQVGGRLVVQLVVLLLLRERGQQIGLSLAEVRQVDREYREPGARQDAGHRQRGILARGDAPVQEDDRRTRSAPSRLVRQHRRDAHARRALERQALAQHATLVLGLRHL